MDFAAVSGYLSYIIYGVLVAIALWGAFCVVMAWRRVGQTGFSGEEEQVEFLEAVEQLLARNDYKQLTEICVDDPRALPQLTLLAIDNRKLGMSRLRVLVMERFQRDVLADLDYRISWVKTIIKAAPMVGLLGTVIGMMGAFNSMSTAGQNVKPELFAGDIMLALITTACGLSIAIPLVLAIASINIRVGRLEDLVGSGLTRLMDLLRTKVS